MKKLVFRNPQDLSRLYARLGEQVKSYHRHYRMGSNTSVSTETAGELLESMVYTAQRAPDGELETGQALLERQLEQVKQRYKLVQATSPDWQSEYRWETLQELGRFLETYDHLHFAHRKPVFLSYPLLSPVPEALLGLDHVSFFLDCLWWENQLLDAMGPAARGSWEQQIPDYWGTPLNLCEQPLIQLLGRSILGLGTENSELSREQRQVLGELSAGLTKEMLVSRINRICCGLEIRDGRAAAYARQAAEHLYPRLRAALRHRDVTCIFL